MQRFDFPFGFDKDKLGDDKKSKRKKPHKILRLVLDNVVILQTMIIILLLINLGAVIVGNAEADIEVVGLNVEDNGFDHNIYIQLKNVGDVKAKVQVMGEIFYYSSSDESQKFFPGAYQIISIEPGDLKDIFVGKTNIDNFIVRVYINWNDGSITYSQRVA